MTKQELYRAVKYEAHEFFADHGMSMPELWAVVNHRLTGVEAIDYMSIDLHDWWRDMCIEDYMRYLQEV